MTYLIIILLILLLLLSYKWISDKNNELSTLKDEKEILENRVDTYRISYINLQKQFEIFKSCDSYVNQLRNKVNNNPQVIEAIKYAMKKSHPDNGGNAEDFRKFRDLYNSMK